MTGATLPPAEVLAEVAARHRIRVADLRDELEHPCSVWGGWSDVEGAARTVRERDRAIRSVAEAWAGRHMRELHALAARYGVPWTAIVREAREGEWPDQESAARHLRDCVAPGWARVPWWRRWRLWLA